MLAAVYNVHHRHGQHMRVDAADIAIERQTTRVCGGFGNRQADAQYRIGTQICLVVGSIEIDHYRINIFLVLGIEIGQRSRYWSVDRFDRLQHAFAHIARHISVAFLGGFIRSGRCARGHCRTTKAAVLQQYINFDSRVASAVENFTGVNFKDGGHSRCSNASQGELSRASTVLVNIWQRRAYIYISSI